MGFECVTRTHLGLRRATNDDRFLANTELGFWAVADGLGGQGAGEAASATVRDQLASIPKTDGFEETMSAALATIDAVNALLLDRCAKKKPGTTIGSTVVGLVIREERAGCFWAGDSRAYRIRFGQMEQLTRDHSLVQEMVDAGRIRAFEADGHPDAEAITRAVGVASDLAVDRVDTDCRRGDIFLLASDGLTRVVRAEEIADMVGRQPLEGAADMMLDVALQRGAPDNVTFVLVRRT